MSLIGFFKGKGPSGFGYGSTAEEVCAGLDLRDQTILITGVNSGLGHETARVLAARGATVLGTARTQDKAAEASERIGGDCRPLVCELSEPRSVRACAQSVRRSVERIDAIVCNAGIMAPPELEQAQGYELQFFVNHVAHFLLVGELLDHLADEGRVVMTSSDLHKIAPAEGIQFDNLSGERGYSGWRAYGQSKLANLLFARALAERFAGTERSANAVHPGVIKTNLDRHMNPVIRAGLRVAGPFTLKTIPEGAATQTWAAVHPDAARYSGEYFVDVNVGEASSKAGDAELARRLWARTEEIIEEVASA